MLLAAVATVSTTLAAVARPPAARAAAAPAHPPVVAAPPAEYFSADWVASHPSPNLGLHARAGIVVDLGARRILWERDSRTPRAPASLAKLMTVMVALDHAGLDRQVTVPEGATSVEPNVMGLSPGEVLTVRELLYGVFLDSGNDAAETLAQGLVPRARFLSEMNGKAAAWGLGSSTFSNPSGLDADGLRATPYGLAVITGHLEADHPEVMAIAGTRERSIPATAQHKAFDPYNLNKLLWSYPGATGLKTGFTDDAGGCVVATATREGRRLVAVVMNSDVFFTDAGRMLDYGFSTPRTQ